MALPEASIALSGENPVGSALFAVGLGHSAKGNFDEATTAGCFSEAFEVLDQAADLAESFGASAPARRPLAKARRRSRHGGCGPETLFDSQPAGSRNDFRRQSAPGRNRTCDLALRRRALYPLSYGRGESQSSAASDAPWS